MMVGGDVMLERLLILGEPVNTCMIKWYLTLFYRLSCCSPFIPYNAIFEGGNIDECTSLRNLMKTILTDSILGHLY